MICGGARKLCLQAFEVKNIQVIDGAENCTYDIFQVSEETFQIIFPEKGQNIEFSEDLFDRLGDEVASKLLEPVWKSRQKKSSVSGIHGTLFYGLLHKKEFYPDKKDDS